MERIFNTYLSSENIPFYFLNKNVSFPEDKTLYIYDKRYVGDNKAWTVLSYEIYGTIDYWWILSSLNKDDIFYAKEGTEILIIKPQYISDIISKIK